MSCPFLTFFDVTHCEAEGIRLLTLGLAEVYPEECERAKEKHEKEAYLDPVKAFRSQEAWVLKDPLWVWARGAGCGDVKRKRSCWEAEEHREKGNELFKARILLEFRGQEKNPSISGRQSLA